MPDQRYAVELTDAAARDLENICDYLSDHGNPEVAAALLDAFLQKIETLESFPYRGAVPKELSALGITEYRQLLLLHYRLIYRVNGSDVVIMIIADGRRDMQALLERRLLAR